ncbi:YgjV family protein [Gilliamella sp. Pas-s95]
MIVYVVIQFFLWVIYSLWIGSLGSLAIEITFFIINIVTIIKLLKK